MSLPLVALVLALGSPAQHAATALAFEGSSSFHQTSNEVLEVRFLSVPGSEVQVARWEERAADGATASWYAIAAGGVTVVRETDYVVHLRHGGGFDPLGQLPVFFASSPLAHAGAGGVYLVQYETQPLAAYRERIAALGGRVAAYVPEHVNLVRMSPAVRDAVAAEPFVRAVLPYHPELRLDESLLGRLGTGELEGMRPYVVWVLDRDAGDQFALAARIAALGGEVRDLSARSAMVGALLSEPQLIALAGLDEVLHVDVYSDLEPDLDLVRLFSGADALEVKAGLTGQDVKGEVADIAVETTHPGFQHNGGVQLHGGMTGSATHGTSVYGIVFGDGTGSPGNVGRGILPDAMGIFADADSFGWLNNANPTNRANHTAELVDPNGPYRGLFQTNSTGSSRTHKYTVVSANMDQIALDNDLVIVQALGNSGNPQSRPEAWGKNIVAVGGIYHFETLDDSDDLWNFGASSGPAEDGRIKPEFAHFYDTTLTASVGGGYTAGFGGSSGSTPITAGHFGLFFQLWHGGAFGNTPTGSDPFESRPHAETALAAMVNTAVQWEFTGSTHQLNRLNQGFGRVDVDNLYEKRMVTVWRDRVPIDNLQTVSFPVVVSPGEPELKVTMVYRDPPAVPGVTVHRVNDLSLRVTDPGGTVYHGNVGLLEGNESVPGGAPNTLDVIENVWVSDPAAGSWNVEVVGVDVNTDLDPIAAGNNADYSLWITGGADGGCRSVPSSYCTAGTTGNGCQALVSASGLASLSSATGFDLTVSNVEGGKLGILFWGTTPLASPWGSGSSWLCVAAPVQRTGTQLSGGTPGGCDGSFSLDFNAWMSANPGQAPAPASTVRLQAWFRDPPSPKTTSLSDAMRFDVCP